MTIRLEISPPYPDGFDSYTWVRVTWVRLARIPFLKEAALRFAKNRVHTLQLEREPSNEYDPNAIRIIGHSKGLVSRDSDHIGYVGRETATCIVEGNRYRVSDNATALAPRGRAHYFINETDRPMAMVWVYAGDMPLRIALSERFCVPDDYVATAIGEHR